MKSLTLCTCMIGMLLLTSVAFGEGEIVYTDDWDLNGGGDWEVDSSQENTVLQAWAYVEHPSSWAEVHAWQRYTVTEDESYEYEYFLGSYSFGEVWRDDDDPHSAYVTSYATVQYPAKYDSAATWVSIDEDYQDWKWNAWKESGPSTTSDSGESEFYEGQSFYLGHQNDVEADITEGSDDVVHAYSIAVASGQLTVE